MKLVYTFYLLCALSFLSCKRDNPDPPYTGKTELPGEWIRVLKSGGIAGISLTPDDGYNIHYVFDENKLYITENAQSFPPVSYSIVQKNSLLSGTKANFITLKSSDCPNCQLMPEYTFRFTDNKDTLILNEDVYDGFTYTYVKKRTDEWQAATYMGVDPRLCPSPCCGGYLLNIDGVTYTTTAFPSGFSMNFDKKPQKLLVKTAPTPYSCAPIPVLIREAKLLP